MLVGEAGNFVGRQLACFTGTLMSSGQLVYYDIKAESSGWLFKSTVAGAGPTTGRTAYSNLCYALSFFTICDWLLWQL